LGNGGGRFAAGYAYYPEDGDFGECGAGHEDAVGFGVEVGRSDLDAVVEKREKIVGYDAFEGLAVQEAETEPEAIKFGAAKEGAAFGLKVVIEVAHKIDGTDTGERELLVLAVLGEQIKGVELAETRGIEVAAEGFAVVELDNHLFVGAGWRAKFQSTSLTPI